MDYNRPGQQFGRRPSAVEGSSPSPRNDDNAFTSAVLPSPRVGSIASNSPLAEAHGPLGDTQRKSFASKGLLPGSSPPPTSGPFGSLFSRLFSRQTTDTPSLGSYPPQPLRTPRPFYDSRTFDGRPPSVLSLARDVALRPFYLMFRRGPLLPLVLLLLALVTFMSYSTHPSTQSVKRRMQGAVGPYIPQRAADAMNWRSSRYTQQVWKAGHGEELGSGRGSKHDDLEDSARGSSSRPALEATLAAPRKDGRLILEAGKKHPIPALMKRAKKQWEELKGRQSKTFAEAVREYRRRYDREPPKGFDKWFAFARDHKVVMIDEFDMIDRDMLLFRAFRPEVLRKRVVHLNETFEQAWAMRIENGKIYREGGFGHHDRAKGVEALMKRFVKHVPDQVMIYNGHDNARIAVAADERDRLETLARKGEYDDDNEPPFEPRLRGQEPHWGMAVFCPPGSAVRQPGFEYGWAPADSTGYEMPPHEQGAVGALVENYRGYMNVCENPQYRHFHCTTSWVYTHHPTPVLPFMSPGVQVTFGDVYAPIVEQFEIDNRHDPTWEERPFSSLVWRGQTSGPLWDKNVPWRTTQRARLHLLSHQEQGSRKIILTDGDDVMRVEEVPNYRLNPLFLDTGMVGPAVQCIKEDGTCDEMDRVFTGYDRRLSLDRAALYKYVLDVDGNSWSGRFRRLMLSNAAVVKATIFPEFWTDWIVPWLHFIPMQVDYSDMWDIMAFFRGGLHGEGAHDELGKEIAQAGQEWVKQCFRWADIEAYQFRLMLEYGRLYNDETSPGSNDFTGDTSIEPVWEGTVIFDR